MTPLTRRLAAIIGTLWIGLAVVRLSGPSYWAPVTTLDQAAVLLFSAAMVGLGLGLWPLGTNGVGRVAALSASAAAITNGLANFLEDWLRIKEFGGVWVLSALALSLALVALAVSEIRAPARGYTVVAVLTVLGLFLIDRGGAFLVGGAWLVCAARWPEPLWGRFAPRSSLPA